MKHENCLKVYQNLIVISNVIDWTAKTVICLLTNGTWDFNEVLAYFHS